MEIEIRNQSMRSDDMHVCKLEQRRTMLRTEERGWDGYSIWERVLCVVMLCDPQFNWVMQNGWLVGPVISVQMEEARNL